MDHNELSKNLYVGPTVDFTNKNKKIKRIKPKELSKEKEEVVALPSLNSKLTGNIIIQQWTTKNEIPKQITNFSLPIIVDQYKYQMSTFNPPRLPEADRKSDFEIQKIKEKGERLLQRDSNLIRKSVSCASQGKTFSPFSETITSHSSNINVLVPYTPPCEEVATFVEKKPEVSAVQKPIEEKTEMIDFATFNRHLFLKEKDFLYCKRVGSPFEYVQCTYQDLMPKQVEKKGKKGAPPSKKIKVKSNVEYITISKNTVLHYHNGNTGIYSVVEWVDNYNKFKKLMELSLFKNFKTAKLFELWRRFFKRTTRTYYTEKLKKKFHQIDPALLNGIFAIREILRDMEEEDIFNIEHKEGAIYISRFQEQHKASITELDNKLDDYRLKVKEELAKACNESYQAYKELKNITLDDNLATSKKKEGDGLKQVQAVDSKNKPEESGSLVQNFLKDAIPYAQDATRKTHYKKLLRYIRVVDFLFNVAKFKLVGNSLTNLCKRISHLYEAYLNHWVDPPILISMLIPMQGEIKYNPHIETIQKALFEEFIQEKIFAVIYRKSFLDPTEFPHYMVCFEEVFEVSVDQNSNLNLRIKEDQSITSTFTKIRTDVENCHAALEKYAASLVPLLTNYITYSNLNFKQLLEDSTPEELKGLLEKFQTEAEIVRKLSKKVNIGIFEFHLDLLIEMVIDAPRSWLDKIRDIIPKVLVNKLAALIQTLNTHIKNLSVHPFNVESFIKLKISVEEIQRNRRSIDDRTTEIYDIIQIVKDDKEIKIPEYDAKHTTELKQLSVEFEKKYDTMAYYIENNITKFRKDLKDGIALFDKYVKTMIHELNDDIINEYGEDTLKPILYLQNKSVEIQKAVNSKAMFQEQEEQMEMDIRDRSTFENLDSLVYEYDLKFKLWTSVKEFQDMTKSWDHNQVLMLDIPKTEGLIQVWIDICALAMLDLDYKQVPKKLLLQVKSYELILPILKAFQNPNVNTCQDFREIIKQILCIDFDLSYVMFTVRRLLEIPDLPDKIPAIVELSRRADEEKKIKDMHKAIMDSFYNRKIPLKVKSNVNEKIEKYYISDRDYDCEYEFIEDNTMKLNKISLSPYAQCIINSISNLLLDFAKYLQFLDLYFVYQIYMTKADGVLSNPEFQKENQQEYKKIVNESANKSLQKALKDNLMMQRYIEHAHDKVKKILTDSNKLTDQNFKAINSYLEKKRRDFPKYFLLSDEDMLDVYDKRESSEVRAKYLPKLLPWIRSIETGTDNDDAMKIVTFENENISIKYTKGRSLKESVEIIEQGINKKLKDTIKVFKKEYENSNKAKSQKKPKEVICELINNKDNIGQIVVNCLYGAMTDSLEKALSQEDDVFDKLFDLHHDSKDERKEMFITMLRDWKATKLERKILINLISLENYFIDIVENLIREDVSSVTDFNFTKILSVRLESENCIVKIFNYSIDYGFDYVGLHDNLMILPSTEKVYLSIANCFQLRKPFFLYGLTQSGKKETMKLFSKVCGKFLTISKCTEQFDRNSFNRLLYANLKSGGWVCLDNVDLIEMNNLSAVSNRIIDIYRYFNECEDDFFLTDVGEKIPMNKKNVNIFCLNNINEKAKRISNTIKQYFRLIGTTFPDFEKFIALSMNNMAYPDHVSISKKIKYVIEYVNSKTSALKYKRIHLNLFQNFYRKLLKMLGKLTQDNAGKIVRLCLEKVFIPFLTNEEGDDLRRLLNNVFEQKEHVLAPSETISSFDVDKLIEESMKNYHFRTLSYEDKLRAILMSLEEKDFYILVGPPLSGKSQAMNIITEISKTLNKRNPAYPIIQYLKLFPKAYSPSFFFAENDIQFNYQFNNIFFNNMLRLYNKENVLNMEKINTQTASNNLLTLKNLERSPTKKFSHAISLSGYDNEDISKDPETPQTNVFKCLFFDGQIDNSWINYITSVQSDHKIHCWPDGYTTGLSEFKIFYETSNLNFVSPGFITRNYIVSFDYSSFGWENIFYAWIESNPKIIANAELKNYTRGLFENYFPKLYDFISTNKLRCVTFNENFVMRNLISLFDCILPSFDFEDKKIGRKLLNHIPRIEIVKKNTLSIFIFASVWVVSFFTNFIIRTKIEKLISDIFKADDLSGPIFEYYINETTYEFEKWENLLAAYPQYQIEYPDNKSVFLYNRIFIPNTENIPYQWIAERYISQSLPVMYTGKPGVGKSLCINSLLNDMNERKTEVSNLRYLMNCNTKSKNIEEYIFSYLDPIKREELGDKFDRKVVLFVDDCNLQKGDDYQSQSSLEYLRQILNNQYIYDMGKNLIKNLGKFNLICCGNLSTYPVNANTDRFIHSFLFISQNITEDSYITLFKQSLEHHLRGYIPNTSSITATQYIQATLKLNETLASYLYASPKKLHYNFSLRDVTRLLQTFHVFCYKGASEYPEYLKKLWFYESCRVYEDRLHKKPDRDFFRKSVVEAYSSVFKQDKVTIDMIFGTWWDTSQSYIYAKDYLNRTNEHVFYKDHSTIYTYIQSKLEEYYQIANIKRKNILLSDDNLQFIIRSLRVYQYEKAHILVLGYDYSGKDSLSRLAAFIAEKDVWDVDALHLQKSKEHLLHNMISRLLSEVVYRNKRIVLFANNKVLEQDDVLEILNNLVNSGEIIHRFPFKEQYEKETGIILSNEEICQRINHNLSLNLSVVPKSETYMKLFSHYPFITKHCRVLLRPLWKEEKYVQLCNEKCGTLPLTININQLTGIFLEIHQFILALAKGYSNKLMCNISISSKNFTDMIEYYEKNYIKYKDLMMKVLKKYEFAVDVIPKCEAVIARINEDLAKLEPLKLENDKLMDDKKKEIGAKTIEKTAWQNKRIDEEKPKMSAELEKADREKQKEEKLSPFSEIVEKFSYPIARIGDKEIVEIKNTWDSFAFGKYLFFQVFTAMGESYTEWDVIKKSIEPKILKSFIIPIDSPNSPPILEKIAQDVVDHPDFATGDKFQRPYKVCGLLCDYFKAINEYYKEYSNQKPLMEEIEKLEKKIQEHKKVIDEYNNQQREVDKCIRLLEKDLNTCEKAKQNFLSQIDKKETLKKISEELISLSQEKLPLWLSKKESVCGTLNNLEFYLLFISAYLHYAPPFNSSYRSKIKNFLYSKVKDLVHLTNVKRMDFVDIMTEFLLESREREDKELIMSLGGYDSYCKENFVMMHIFNKKVPYIIDHLRLGKVTLSAYLQWKDMKSIIATSHIETTQDMYDKIDSSMKNGSILFIEQCDERIYNLMRNVIHDGVFYGDKGKRYVLIDGVPKEINEKFKVFFLKDKIDTKINAKTWIDCLVINFAPNKRYYENNLLKAVAVEQDSLTWTAYSKVQTELVKDKLRVIEAEDKINYSMNQFDYSGNVEKNSQNQNVLDKFKLEVQSHSAFQIQYENNRDKFLKCQSDLAKYSLIAADATKIYKWLIRFIYLDNIYSISLSVFCKLVKQYYLDKFPQNPDPTGAEENEYRKENLLDLILYIYKKLAMIFTYTQRRMLIILLLFFYLSELREIPSNFKSILTSIQDLFFKKEMDSDNYHDTSPIKSIDSFQWNCLRQINDQGSYLFTFLLDHIEHNPKEWDEYLAEDIDYSSLKFHFTHNFELFTNELESKVNVFVKFIFFSIVKPHRIDQLEYYVNRTLLGKDFVIPKMSVLNALKYTGRKPLLIIDSDDLVEKQLRDYHYKNFVPSGMIDPAQGFRPMTLRGEQNEIEVIRSYVKNGGMIILKNIHIAKETIQKIIDEINEGKILLSDSCKLIFICKSNLVLSSIIYENCNFINRNTPVFTNMRDYINDLVENIQQGTFDYLMNRKSNVLYSRKIFIHFLVIHNVILQFHLFQKGIYHIPMDYGKKDFYSCIDFITNYLKNYLTEDRENAFSNMENESGNNYISLITIALDSFYGNRLVYREEVQRVMKMILRYFDEERFMNENYFFFYSNSNSAQNSFAIKSLNDPLAIITQEDLMRMFDDIPFDHYYHLLSILEPSLLREKLTCYAQDFYHNLSIIISGETVEASFNKSIDIKNAAIVIPDLKSRLPDQINIQDANPMVFKLNKQNDYLNPLDEALRFEINSYNKYLDRLNLDLNIMNNMLNGENTLTEEYYQMICLIGQGILPSKWKEECFTYERCPRDSPLTIAFWREEFLKRFKLLNTWITNGGLVVYHIPLFYNLKLFVFAVTNYFAKKYSNASNVTLSPENIKLKFFFTKYYSVEELTQNEEQNLNSILKATGKEVLFCDGLILENAYFDPSSMRITPKHNEKQGVDKCPILGVTYNILVEKAKEDEEDEDLGESSPHVHTNRPITVIEENLISIPIYDRDLKENFEVTEPLSYVEVQTDPNYKEDFWMIKSVKISVDF